MKWFLIGLVSAFCFIGTARAQEGTASSILEKKGTDALADSNYPDAIKAFDEIVKKYPNTPNMEFIQLKLGFAYFYAGDFANCITTLTKLAAPTSKSEYHAIALYFTGLAQFSQGQRLQGDKTKSGPAFSSAVLTFTSLVSLITTAPTADNKDFLEDAIWYRALAQFGRENYPEAEKDLTQLLKDFPQSLKRPDYLMQLGSIHAVLANDAVVAKKKPEEIQAEATKAIDWFSQVSADPNALVQANAANMYKAQVLFLLADLFRPATDGYQKALEAFRVVRRKQDMIDLQQTRLDQLKKQNAETLRNNAGSGTGAAMASAGSRLIGRETGRLAELQSGPDPIILALVRMAECYVAMRQPDESRTILHRLQSHSELDTQLKQEVDFQTLLSYALGGQVDKANKALDDYLAKHAADPQADSISFLIAQELEKRKDYDNALAQAQRSLKDFPKGRLIPDVHSLMAKIYTDKGDLPKANEELGIAAKLLTSGPGAVANKLTLAQGQTKNGDLEKALDTYKSVKDDTTAGEMQSFGALGYIQTLAALNRFEDVITEGQAYITKYASAKELPNVLYLVAIANDQKKEPNDAVAISSLQDIAKKYPTSDIGPYSLFSVVTIYQKKGDTTAMIKAAGDLAAAFPTSFALILSADDSVSDALVKQKKYDDAIALYQPLLKADKPEIVAGARNKIAGLQLDALQLLGNLKTSDKKLEAEKRLSAAEQGYVETLKNNPDQLDAVGVAFDGLTNVLKQRRAWGMVTDATMGEYLGKITAGLTSPDMKARVDLAKAGLFSIFKKPDKTAALEEYRKVVAANPGLVLSRPAANQYGELLIFAKDYATAQKVYGDLLTNAGADVQMKADGYFGVGSAYLAQGDTAKAAENFAAIKKLPNGGNWFPHLDEVEYGLALAGETSDVEASKAAYAKLMVPPASTSLQARATLGYGRLLEKAGAVVKSNDPKIPNDFAIHYYQQPDLLYAGALPETSAEGLYLAGKAYAKAGDAGNAKANFDAILTKYPNTSWAAKAKSGQ